jgi:hypothetical protein
MSSFLVFRREIFVAFIVFFMTTILRDGHGSAHGLFLSYDLQRNFNGQREGVSHKKVFRLRNQVDSPTASSERSGKGLLMRNEQYESEVLQSRDRFLRILQSGGAALTLTTIIPIAEVEAFDGGVGGLGKTKPETGVELFDETSAPIQNDRGIVSSEIKGMDGSPILVSFQTPWPLLPTSGALEARDIRSTESAFVQVASLSTLGNNAKKWKDKKQFQYLLMDSVFAAKGKFGAYGQPYDIQLKPVVQNSSDNDYTQASFFAVTFTTLTPAMRESERKALIAAQQVGADTLVLLVVTTTSVRYSSNVKTFQTIASSFEAIAAPQSSLKKGYSSSN